MQIDLSNKLSLFLTNIIKIEYFISEQTKFVSYHKEPHRIPYLSLNDQFLINNYIKYYMAKRNYLSRNNVLGLYNNFVDYGYHNVSKNANIDDYNLGCSLYNDYGYVSLHTNYIQSMITSSYKTYRFYAIVHKLPSNYAYIFCESIEDSYNEESEDSKKDEERYTKITSDARLMLLIFDYSFQNEYNRMSRALNGIYDALIIYFNALSLPSVLQYTTSIIESYISKLPLYNYKFSLLNKNIISEVIRKIHDAIHASVKQKLQSTNDIIANDIDTIVYCEAIHFIADVLPKMINIKVGDTEISLFSVVRLPFSTSNLQCILINKIYSKTHRYLLRLYSCWSIEDRRLVNALTDIEVNIDIKIGENKNIIINRSSYYVSKPENKKAPAISIRLIKEILGNYTLSNIWYSIGGITQLCITNYLLFKQITQAKKAISEMVIGVENSSSFFYVNTPVEFDVLSWPNL